MTLRESSPSQTALSESSLDEKALCDYVVNVADGCAHGCSFCYVPSMPMIWGDPGDKFADAGIDDPADEWGEYTLYRDDLPANLRDDVVRHFKQGFDNWRTSPRGGGVVGISFGTDCYMDPRAGDLTNAAIEILTFRDDALLDSLEDDHGFDRADADAYARPVRILTRNPKLAYDIRPDCADELGRKGLLTVGTSIPSLNEAEVGALEPGAPPVQQRLNGLASWSKTGVPVYVSMSPTYPSMEPADLRKLLRELKQYRPEVVFHEPINPRSENFQDCIEAAHEAGEWRLQQALEAITVESAWRDYAYEQLQTVQRLAEQVGVTVHEWPDGALLPALDDNGLPDAPDADEAWAWAWRQRTSPERIGAGEPCLDGYPAVPARSRQRPLADFEDDGIDGLVPDEWHTVIEREKRNDNRLVSGGERA